MGCKTDHKKIIIVAISFVLTSIAVYSYPNARVVKKSLSLYQSLTTIGDWSSHSLMMDSQIKNALALDDVFFSEFSKPGRRVTLYIGYYYSTKKIGVAHSPLVCFPGQGWVVSNKEEKHLTIRGNNLRLMSMIVERGQTKELVIYWFQAFDKAFPGTFAQKLYALWAKALYSREDNAFVRVSVPIHNQTIEEAFATGFEFIKKFYPYFINFVNKA